LAAALIDRLMPHCHVVNIRGNSCRMREHTDLWQAIQPEQEGTASPNSRVPEKLPPLFLIKSGDMNETLSATVVRFVCFWWVQIAGFGRKRQLKK
jgi:hypothetical protein